MANFETFMKDVLGLKEYTDSGFPSTIWHYSKAVLDVMEREHTSEHDFNQLIDYFVFHYSPLGMESKYGQKSNSTVYYALIAYAKYLQYLKKGGRVYD